MADQIFSTISTDELLSRVAETVRDVFQAELIKGAQKKEPEQFLTRAEVADLLKVTLPTLHSYTKEGLIPVHRIGSRILYQRTEVIEACAKIVKYARV